MEGLKKFRFPIRELFFHFFTFKPLLCRPRKSAALRFAGSSKTLNPSKHHLLVRASSMATSPPPPVHVNDTILLTEKEQLIFDRLLQVVRHYNLQTQLRVAGGWVRDKLLGKDRDDIDIALDNMKGREFCDKITEYLSSSGEALDIAL